MLNAPCLALVLLPLWAAVSAGQAPETPDQNGQALYRSHCAGCHDAPQGRIPPVAALRAMSQAHIFDALDHGVMKMQAAGLSTADKNSIAHYLGLAETAAVSVAIPNACPARLPVSGTRPATAGWTSWGIDLANSRFQPTPGFTPAQVPQLKLKWAFNLGADAETRSQPAILDGTVYVGAAQLYALDAITGCVHWSFTPDAPVRSGISINPDPANPTLFFGDYKGQIYAVHAVTGRLLWKAHVDTNFAAMVTGTPVFFNGKIYAGVSSFEEVMAASPKYACCSFRGSVVALDASTGASVWKTYTISDPPSAVAGTPFFGPSGGGVWSSPTIDVKLRRVYVATGDNYSLPATSTSDAVLAFDLDTGKLLWSRQATSGDIYNVGCDPTVHGACPETHGHDFDFGQPPILLSLPNGKRALVLGQKSGFVHAFDPDADGNPLWSTRIGEGGTLGGIQWGSAAHDGRVFVALSDLRLHGVADSHEKLGYRLEGDGTKGGGLFALDAATGKVLWNAKPTPCGTRPSCSPAQSAPVTAIPGVVFSGALDGHLRAFDAATGAVVWDTDTERSFDAVNGGSAHGGSLDVAGPVVVGGALYVMSGYGKYGGLAGNVLLAFGPIQKNDGRYP